MGFYKSTGIIYSINKISIFFQHLTPVFFRYTGAGIKKPSVKVLNMYRLTFALLLISFFAFAAEPVYEIEDMSIYGEGFELVAGLDDEDIAEIDSMLEGYDDDFFENGSYVCLGSFRSQNKAKTMSTGLSVAGYEVIVRSAFVSGSEFYRVLVGPVAEDRAFQEEFMQWLLDMGYEGAWLVKGVKVNSLENELDFSDELSSLEQPEKSLEKKQPIRKEPLIYPGQDTDYNPARLRLVTE